MCLTLRQVVLSGIAAIVFGGCELRDAGDETVRVERAPALAPVAAIDAGFDDRFGLITLVDVVECNVVLYDHGVPGLAVVAPGADTIAFFGRKGSGPGEFVHPRALVHDARGRVLLVDWVQRRLIAFAPHTRAPTTLPASYALERFGIVGKMVSLPDGGFASLWASDDVGSTRYLPPDELARHPLVVRLDENGQWTEQGWGTARLSAQDSTVLLHIALQAGDIAIAGDSLYVLNAIAGEIQLFSIAQPSATPSRTIELTRYFTPQEPSESDGYRPTPDAEKSAAIPRAVTIADPLAAALAVMPTGEIVVLAYELVNGQTHERLDVYDRLGRRSSSYALDTRSTRTLRVLRDGTIVLLANRDQERLSDRSVLFFRISQTVPAGGQNSCGW